MRGTIPLFSLSNFMARTRAILNVIGAYTRLNNKCRNVNYGLFCNVDEESYFKGPGETYRTLILSFFMGRNLVFHIKKRHRR